MPVTAPKAATPKGLMKRSWHHTRASDFDVFISTEPVRLDDELINEYVRGGLDESLAPQAKTDSRQLTRQPSVRLPIDEAIADSLSAQYLLLGSLRQREQRRFKWSANPAVSVEVLIARSRVDRDSERLSEVSAILSMLGSNSMSRVIEELGGGATQRTNECTESLFRAVYWSKCRLTELQESKLRDTLERTIANSNNDVRLAAYEAAELLSIPRQIRFLRMAVARESDKELRAYLNSVLDSISK